MQQYLPVVFIITFQLCHVLNIYVTGLKNRFLGRPGALSSVPGEKTIQTNKSLTLLWGATGEQEWTPALTTGGFTKTGHNACH
jgi:hypothetical protein